MKKHTKQIISGAVLFILGAFIVPVIFIIYLFLSLLSEKPLARFIFPNEVKVTIENKGKYYLWNEYETIFEGRTYASSKYLPDGIQISLIDTLNGSDIKFISDFSITSSGFNSEKKSIGYFEIERPGNYILKVTGNSEPRILSLGKSLFSYKLIVEFFMVFLLVMLMGIVGFLLIIMGIINYIKARRLENSINPAPLHSILILIRL